MTELDRRFQRFVEDLHAVVLFHHRSDAAHHAHCLGFVRLVHLHGLEAPRQRGVFFDVLLVLGKRGRPHGAQGATRQCGLEQDARAADGLAEALGVIDRARPADVVRQVLVEGLLERGIGFRGVVGRREFGDRAHQGLGDETPAVAAEMAVGIREGVEIGDRGLRHRAVNGVN